MEILNFIYHGVEKEQAKKGIIDFFLSEELIEVAPDDQKLTTFLNTLRERYNKSGPSYGKLDKNPDANFTKHLNSYIEKKIDFIKFTHLAFRLLKEELKDNAPASGGLVVFLEYNSQSKHYILIALLKEKDVMLLNKEKKKLVPSQSLDIEKMNEAARITINGYLTDEQPYLSFIKKSSNKKITDYFIKGLNCIDYTDSKHFTDNLLEGYRKYAESKCYDRCKKHEDEKRIYDLFERVRKDKRDNKSDGLVTLEAISAELDYANPQDFLDFINENESINIPHGFEPHRDTYRRLERFRGKDGDILFSFNRADYDSGKVSVDNSHNNETIVSFTITDQKTRDELKEFNTDHDQSTS